MNIIVTNKYKNLIYNANIEVLKELSGVFKVREIVNSFNNIFYKKIIIDATALENFPKQSVLEELSKSFDMDKLILFIPPDNPPPKTFLSFLVSLHIYNFTDNINGLIELTRKSNTYEDVKEYDVVEETKEEVTNTVSNSIEGSTIGRIILSLKGVNTSYGTNLLYMIMHVLEDKYKKRTIGIEIEKRDFMFYNKENMYSILNSRIKDILASSLDQDVVLIDLSNYSEEIGDDVLYLIDPSLYSINKLMFEDRDAFLKLKGKKVILVNSLLNDNDVNQFSKEAGISIYYNLPPLNDRIINHELDKLLIKLGIVSEDVNKSNKKGLFDIFK